MPKCRECKHEEKHANEQPCVSCYKYSNFVAKETALDKQEGGQHYKDNAIQPIVYIHANKLGFCEGNVVKYITRHKEKNGAEDIRKIIHYCELLLELEYKNE
jgi:hypothetical protein